MILLESQFYKYTSLCILVFHLLHSLGILLDSFLPSSLLFFFFFGNCLYCNRHLKLSRPLDLNRPQTIIQYDRSQKVGRNSHCFSQGCYCDEIPWSKQNVEERTYWTQISTALFIPEGSQDRNSIVQEPGGRS